MNKKVSDHAIIKMLMMVLNQINKLMIVLMIKTINVFINENPTD